MRTIDAQVLGVLYDFMGFLTTRDTPMTLSRHNTPDKGIKAVAEFIQLRNVKNVKPDMAWEKLCEGEPIAISKARLAELLSVEEVVGLLGDPQITSHDIDVGVDYKYQVHGYGTTGQGPTLLDAYVNFGRKFKVK